MEDTSLYKTGIENKSKKKTEVIPYACKVLLRSFFGICFNLCTIYALQKDFRM